MKALSSLAFSYMSRSRGHFVFASVGLIVGTATLVFFLGLSGGIREKVLNRLYPVNQVEFQLEKVRIFGLGIEVPARLDDAVLASISRLDGVAAAYPKQRSRFQARLWGGGDILGTTARVEAFFDGIRPDLIVDELRQSEIAALGPESTGVKCSSAAECGPGSGCVSGSCIRTTWWNQFHGTGGVVSCSGDDGCPPGENCLNSVCSKVCAGGVACRTSCADSAASCAPGEICGDDRMCHRLTCRLESAGVQMYDDPVKLRGSVTGLADGVTGAALPEMCPQDSYCAAVSTISLNGYCEGAIPVLLSPFLLDVYNDVAATALGMRRLSGMEVTLGVKFAMLFGESYFAPDAPAADRIVRRCYVVGFSDKAMEFGVTMPLDDVVRANAMLRGRDLAAEYTSVVVETKRNEDVPALVEDLKVLGLVLAPRSEAGRKAANVLMLLTLIFAAVSLIILMISAINIAHTFLMLVSERRREIAIYRSVGATIGDIRMLVLGEALVLGLAGGIVGNLCGWLLSRAANQVAASVLSRIPGSPTDLFAFTPTVFAVSLLCAVIFALLGAWGPSRRASRMDPAGVLSQN